MTERPDAERHRQAHGSAQPDAEHDPTGVRTLLSALADPAPMPDHLVQRISASLAREQSLREESQRLGTVHSLVAARAASEGGADHNRRRPLARRLPSIAVAASIVVLAGAVLVGLISGGLVGGGADSSAGAMLSSDGGREQAADASVMGESAEGGAGGPDAPQEDSDGTAEMAGPLVLTTGTVLTAATLESHAQDLLARTLLTPDEEAAQRFSASALNTPSGVADCLAGLLSQPADELEPRLDAIDVVVFGGTTAVLALLADAAPEASDPGGPATAYLVPLTCRGEDAVALHDPVRVG